MSFKKIPKEVLKVIPNLEGYYRYDIDGNTYYQGKLKQSKRNGYGALYRDGKVLWEGMWMDDDKIDDVVLPNADPIDEADLDLESCQKMTFKFEVKNPQLNFDLTYSVPSKHIINLRRIIDKVIKQTNYSLDEKDVSITVSKS